ncbi:hypothetical protein GMDG_05603 [Pseudogymnoascus destructans 20631-21]|uniref:DASH complex subunit DUO1 n=1 Tax=Pseudogymnoascus destructans (strain ATCC MYA-4855 / 20631-21) TaxID=658429 RepID=L8FP32_PSED2|nr:hypothetical protein GMDG_05603 [Pseudogymnoascus destructans 20631-21]
MAPAASEKLDISDTEEDLFASPSRSPRATSFPKPAVAAATAEAPRESRYDAEAARTATLQRELASLQDTNAAIEGVIASLESARGSMGTVSTTVTSASTLLNTWTRMLGQTEHNQRLLLDPNWKGASQDLVDAENEVVMRAQAAERRAAEEARRREEARAKAEEEERVRLAGGTTRGRVSRGRGRGRGLRGSVTGSSVGGQETGVGAWKDGVAEGVGVDPRTTRSVLAIRPSYQQQGQERTI